MKWRRLLTAAFLAALASSASGAETDWENPILATEEEAVAAARRTRESSEPPPRGLRMFLDLTLGDNSRVPGHLGSTIKREVVNGVLITYPSTFAENPVQRQTIDRFRAEIERQRSRLSDRLARFGYPELEGLVFLRLVADVDAFADLNQASSDRMSRVGGVTYYCRYVVLPLSYVGDLGVQQLRREAARNPSLDVDGTIRRWQRESFASLVNTFRHEMVHVHTNTTLGVPAYRDRAAVPTWFHEGTATYLAGDPHAGLSARYQEYQELFFYLARRHGVRKLQDFFSEVLGGRDVSSALTEVYDEGDSERLFARSRRWHRGTDAVITALWIAALLIPVAAFRGRDLPYIAVLQLLAALGLVFAVASGLADHLYGLRGPGVVLGVEAMMGIGAAFIGIAGARRVVSFRRTRN